MPAIPARECWSVFPRTRSPIIRQLTCFSSQGTKTVISLNLLVPARLPTARCRGPYLAAPIHPSAKVRALHFQELNNRDCGECCQVRSRQGQAGHIFPACSTEARRSTSNERSWL